MTHTPAEREDFFGWMETFYTLNKRRPTEDEIREAAQKDSPEWASTVREFLGYVLYDMSVGEVYELKALYARFVLRQPAAPGYTREDMLALLKHVLPDNDVFGRPFRSNHETILDAFLASWKVQPL